MTTSKKDKLVDGVECRKSIEEYEQRNYHPASLNTVSTLKRGYEDSDNDLQEIANDEFQTVEKNNRKNLDNY